MISGAPPAARWLRSEPRRSLPASDLDPLIRRAFGSRRVIEIQPLSGGYRNANFKVRLDHQADPVVFRIYEHDPSLCRKEVDVMQLVAGSVPVPEVLCTEPAGLGDLPPFVVLSFVEGITFRDLKRGKDRTAIAEAAFSAGETLAAIGKVKFPSPGWLGPGPKVMAPLLEGENPTLRFVDSCLESTNLQRRVPGELRDRTRDELLRWAPQFARLDAETHLAHGDFGKRNLLVRCLAGHWRVEAVLDWEYAISSSPLVDIGHFLRYERSGQDLLEPHFSQGYLAAGGTLPADWQRLAALLDLTALCETLTHDELPDPVVAELLELVRNAVDAPEISR